MNPLFATPLITDESQCLEELNWEIERCVIRSRATTAFLAGRIDVETWEDILNENGVDVVQAAEDWSEGMSYL